MQETTFFKITEESPSILVIDDFYDRPYDIRNAALNLNFERESNSRPYSGRQAVLYSRNWLSSIERLKGYINEPVIAPNSKQQGVFRLALALNQRTRPSNVHCDQCRWTVVIYLSKPQDCQGGTSWYRHRQTGALEDSENWCNEVFKNYNDEESESSFYRRVKEHSLELKNWEEIQKVSMTFNRAVVFRGNFFHGATGFFGSDKFNGRLTQHFEFDLH